MIISKTGSLSVELQDREREPVLRRLRVTPLGFWLRVIVKETHIDHEKTTSSVLYVILINLCKNV